MEKQCHPTTASLNCPFFVFQPHSKKCRRILEKKKKKPEHLFERVLVRGVRKRASSLEEEEKKKEESLVQQMTRATTLTGVATSTSKLHQDKLHCFFHYRTSYKRQTLFRCKLFEYNNKKVFTLRKLTGILSSCLKSGKKSSLWTSLYYTV